MGAHVSPYSGTWYPHRERKLNALLGERFDESLERTGPSVLPGAVALLVPHAAPQYCGAVAASAYRHVQAAQPDRVFVLGFSHRGDGRGVEIPSLDAYRTPLGEVAVDRSAIRALCSAAPFRLVDEFVVCDHSVEVQLPWLQRAAPAAAVVPIYVGQLDEQQRTEAAQALARLWRPGDILIASSDLTHYGPDFHYVPFPADGRIAARLRALDRRVMESASSLDDGMFLQTVCESGATVCGYRPIALLLRTLSLLGAEDIFQHELDYQTSGEITGDFSGSVSYGAFGYFRRASFELGEVEQRELLLSAQATLANLRAGREQVVLPRRLPALARRAAAFVTLRHAGSLLGCVGRLACDLPLAEVVPDLALSAALHDPRRPPGALPDGAAVEISVLTPMKLVRSVESLRIGEDGAYVEIGGRSALLLPQAAGRDWTASDLLDALFRKAGLPADEGPPVEGRLFRFRAQVFRSGPAGAHFRV